MGHFQSLFLYCFPVAFLLFSWDSHLYALEHLTMTQRSLKFCPFFFNLLSVPWIEPQRKAKPQRQNLSSVKPSCTFSVFFQSKGSLSRHTFILPLFILFSYCCCNKISQTSWLKTTQIYYFIVL